MGRPTQLTERYAGGTGYRSRFSLGFFHGDPGSGALNPCGVDAVLGTPARVDLTSEWVDGVAWPGCASLHWTSTEYDGLNRPSVQRLPDGSQVTTYYTGAGTGKTTRTVQSSITGLQTEMAVIATSDGLGRLRRVREQESALESGADSVMSEYGYDALGRLLSVQVGTVGQLQPRTFAYSDAGFLTATTEPERHTQYLGYDALGSLRRSKRAGDPAHLTGSCDAGQCAELAWWYDGYGRLEKTSVLGQLVSSFTYGDTFEGGSVPVGYPSYGKVTASRGGTFFPDGFVDVTHRWAYGGPGGRPSLRTTQISGIGVSTDSFAVGYGYDTWGNLSTVDYPSWLYSTCNRSLTRHDRYDGSWLLDVSLQAGGEHAGRVASLDYSPSGRVHRVAFGEDANGSPLGWQDEEPDPDGMARPFRYSLTWQAGNPFQWTEGRYYFDGSGNVTGTGAPGASGPRRRYSYDALDRLRSFVEDYVEVESYAYDRWGNLTSRDRGGQTLSLHLEGTGAQGSGVPATNRVDTVNGLAVAWDGLGNLTRLPAVDGQRAKSFLFSADDRLLQAVDEASGTRWRYAYDASGERVVQWRRDLLDPTKEAEVRLNLRDEGGQVLSDWLLIPGESFTVEHDYVAGAGRSLAQVGWSGNEPLTSYVAVDHLGSTRLLVAEDGTSTSYLYYPQGELRSTDLPKTSHLFTSHERDLGTASSELDYMHARYYWLDGGRFISIDPVGGSIGSSQSWNRYSYALNNPLKYTDPDGKLPLPIILGVIFALGAAEYGNTPQSQSDPVVTEPAFQNSQGMRGLLGASKGAALGSAMDFAFSSSEESTESVGPPTVQENKATGDAFRDEIASGMEQEGFTVEKEVPKKTPFGPRVIDVEVSKDGEVKGGIETKSGDSPYKPSQRAKDEYLRRQGYPVDVVRDN
jgi:RHS repeat-associated protein